MQKGKHSKRYPAGSMASANWRQIKGLLRADNSRGNSFEREAMKNALALQEPVHVTRIRSSLEPARDHAALVESDRQNRFAAELWKAVATKNPQDKPLPDAVLDMLIYATDQQVLDIYNIVEAVAQKRGLMG